MGYELAGGLLLAGMLSMGGGDLSCNCAERRTTAVKELLSAAGEHCEQYFSTRDEHYLDEALGNLRLAKANCINSFTHDCG